MRSGMWQHVDKVKLSIVVTQYWKDNMDLINYSMNSNYMFSFHQAM